MRAFESRGARAIGPQVMMIKRISDFMVRIGGAQEQVLELVPAERPRFIAIGNALLITAGTAAVSMVFAFSYAFQRNEAISIILGLVWGSIILSLDRWLLT